MTKRTHVDPGLYEDDDGEPALEAGRVAQWADLAKAAEQIRALVGASTKLTLDAGPHLLRLTFEGGFNFDYLWLSR